MRILIAAAAIALAPYCAVLTSAPAHACTSYYDPATESVKCSDEIYRGPQNSATDCDSTAGAFGGAFNGCPRCKGGATNSDIDQPKLPCDHSRPTN